MLTVHFIYLSSWKLLSWLSFFLSYCCRDMWQGKSSIEPQDHEELGFSFFLMLNNTCSFHMGWLCKALNEQCWNLEVYSCIIVCCCTYVPLHKRKYIVPTPWPQMYVLTTFHENKWNFFYFSTVCCSPLLRPRDVEPSCMVLHFYCMLEKGCWLTRKSPLIVRNLEGTQLVMAW